MSTKDYATRVEKAVKLSRQKKVPLMKRVRQLENELRLTKKEITNEINNVSNDYNVNPTVVSKIINAR